jgi:hypothetical protein
VKNQLDLNLSFVILDDSTDDFNYLKIEHLLKPASTEFFESEEKLEFDGETKKTFSHKISFFHIYFQIQCFIFTQVEQQAFLSEHNSSFF